MTAKPAVNNAEALRAVGLVHRRKKDAKKAVQSFLAAVQADPQDHTSLNNLSEIFWENKEFVYAIEYAMRAVLAEAPDAKTALTYKQRFLGLVSVQRFSEHSTTLQETLERCLRSPDLNCRSVAHLCYSMLIMSPEFSKVYRVRQQGDNWVFDRAHFDAVKDYSPLMNSFFLACLENIIVSAAAFEDFLTHLRHLLLTAHQGGSKLPGVDTTALTAALAHYCLFTDYIFDTMEEEESAVRKINARIEESDSPNEADLLISACYQSLHKRSNAEAIYAAIGGYAPAAARVVREHIGEWLDMRARKKDIITLTPIEDATSLEVQKQYEEFPYPRWKGAPQPTAEPTELLPPHRPRILIAGCGTGQDPLSYAANYPQADIVAVDLSRASLSYAIKKAQELGVKNITFRQADILKLPEVFEDKPFDYIASMGVLHHMKDPMTGWRALYRVLKPGGVLKAGLYSRSARWAIDAARAAIAAGRYTDTAEGMRLFRRESPSLLSAEVLRELQGFSDYYTLNMYRDLLFHVQEHTTDIAGIQKTLEDTGLSFDSFLLPFAVMPLYTKMFPNDRKANDLERWKLFERQHPEVFRGMYQFWCRKPA